jgi:MFS family permease
MTAFHTIVLLSVLTHTSFKGSKVLVSLYALELGASPLAIGALFSVYSLFPVVLSIYAGKLSDRYGYRLPMVFGAFGLGLGLLLPFLVPRLAALYFSAGMIGLCYIFYIVSVQHLVGSIGEGAARTRNYSLFSLGIGVTALIGPMIAGLSIDQAGHRGTYLLFALLPAIAGVLLFANRALFPPPPGARDGKSARRVGDLLANRPLRRALMATAIVEAGLELFNFYLPIYAHGLGFSATQIGIIMAAFGAALLLVRVVMPHLAQRTSEERVLSASLLLGAATAVLFPLVESFALLLAIAFVLGLGLGCGSPLSMVLAYNRSPPGRSGEAIGLRQTANKITEVLVPLVFGSLGTALGIAPVFWMNALMLATGGWIMHRDAGSRNSVRIPAIEQETR